MVRLSAEQMREWDEQGFVVIPIPSGVQLAASVSPPHPTHPTSLSGPQPLTIVQRTAGVGAGRASRLRGSCRRGAPRAR